MIKSARAYAPTVAAVAIVVVVVAGVFVVFVDSFVVVALFVVVVVVDLSVLTYEKTSTMSMCRYLLLALPILRFLHLLCS